MSVHCTKKEERQSNEVVNLAMAALRSHGLLGRKGSIKRNTSGIYFTVIVRALPLCTVLDALVYVIYLSFISL